MATSIYRLSAVALMAATVLSSCAKLPKQSKFIPANAVFVLDVNTRQLTNKLVSGGLSFDKLVSASEKTSAAAKGHNVNDSTQETTISKGLKQAQNSGIDLTDHFFATYVQDTVDNSKSYASMVVSLTDSAKFAAFLKSTAPEAKTGKGSDFSFVYMPEQNTIIGYNADNAISIIGIDASRFARMGRNMYGGQPAISDIDTADTAASDSTQAAIPATPPTPPMDTLEHFWAGRLESLFHLKDSERATSFASLQSQLKTGADVSVWVNPTTLYRSEYFLKMPGDFRKLLGDSYYTASLNFEDGKVVASSSAYLNASMDSILKKYNTNIDGDMLKNYPSEKIDGFLIYGFDPHIIGDVLNAMKLYELADVGMQAAVGVSLGDALNAFSGQIVAIGSDYSMVKKPSSWDSTEMTTQTEVKWLVSAKVKDKAAFQRIMESKNVSMLFSKEGDHYVPVMQDSKAFVADVNLDHLTFANDAQVLAQYGAGKSGKVDANLVNHVKGNTTGYYANLNQLLSASMGMDPDTTTNNLIKDARDLFQDITADQYPVKDKVVKSEFVLNLKDKSKNSLAALVSFSLNAFERMKASEARAQAQWDQQMVSDSTTTMVDTTSIMIAPPPPPEPPVKKHK